MLDIAELTKNIEPSKKKTTKAKISKNKRKANRKTARLSNREAAALKSRQESESVREIGPLPEIVNPDRRAQCKLDFRYHLVTYMPEVFYMKFAEIHEDAIKNIVSAVLDGSYYAYAMPRGTGKSALARGGMHWGISHGHIRFGEVFVSGSDKVSEFINPVKQWFTSGPSAEDFPEIAFPINALEGNNIRTKGQRLDGEATNIEWKETIIRLPTVEGSESSGSIIKTKSISSKGIRGASEIMPDGSIARPDFIICDDPQTDEGAKNPRICKDLLKRINKTIVGLAGPDDKMGIIIPCTIIEPDDAMHQILDHKLYPRFRGKHVKMLPSLPENMEIWEGEYRKLYEECLLSDPQDFTPINEYYKEHHEEMTKGATSSWPERKGKWADAIQLGMHYYLDDKEMFYCEYQNDPGALITEDDIRLRPGDVLSNLNGFDRYEQPEGYAIETMAIDINDYGLNAAHVYSRLDMTGVVSDYFEYTPDNRGYIWQKDCGLQKEAEIEKAIISFMELYSVRYPNCIFGIDGNYMLKYAHSAMKVLKRKGINVYVLRGTDYKKYRDGTKIGDKKLLRQPGERCEYRQGVNGPEIWFDSNWWHMQTQGCFKIKNPSRGSLSVWGAAEDYQQHYDFADECTVDVYKSYNYQDYNNMYEIVKIPGRNDKFDAVGMCQILANLHGASFAGTVDKQQKTMTLSEMKKKSKHYKTNR
ncbi:MAG: hypothetical protein BBJ57_02035 [Desulfobacterales bacterium PC51MH44]|nr:MAG: hypothetical protein BBJ57_02035 [Desulfobacterales bacterium PC51MH44]